MKTHNLEKENIFKLFFVYAIPAMIGIGVFSLYSFVDAIFVSNVCGENALAAVAICAPVLSIFSCFSVIIGVGGNTLVGIELGKKDSNKACEIFSLASFLTIILSLVFLVLLVAFTRPVAYLLGADESVVDYVCDYLSFTLRLVCSVLYAQWFLGIKLRNGRQACIRNARKCCYGARQHFS